MQCRSFHYEFDNYSPSIVVHSRAKCTCLESILTHCSIGSYNTFRRDSGTVLLSEVEVAAEVNTTLVLRYVIYFQISSTLTWFVPRFIQSHEID
jgi:hypothetical protein